MDNIIELGGEIYVLNSFLANYGVDFHILNNGISRNKKKKTIYYEHFVDAIHKKRKWIKYSSLSPHLNKKYSLPLQNELLDALLIEKGDKIFNLINTKLDYAFHHEYRLYRKYYDGIFFDSSVVDSYARTHAVFSSSLELKQFGMKIKELYKVYINFQGLQFSTKNIKSFYQKLKDYEVQGHRVFIHASYGTIKAKYKVTDKHIEMIENLYKDSKQLSTYEIEERINHWAVLNGFDKLSISTIKKITGDEYFQNKCKPYRNGNSWKKKYLDSYQIRIHPEYNGTLWEIDGTTLQFRYLNNKKEGKLTIFIVFDVHSRKIIGFSLSEFENSNMIIEAIKMAVKNCMYIPSSLVMDNSMAFKHKNFKFIENQMTNIGCGTQFRKHFPQNPNDKGHVERFFSTFQSRICKNYEGYIGEGITSQREEGRPDPFKIKKSRQLKNLMSYKELYLSINKMVEEYNDLKINGRPSPNSTYGVAKLDDYASQISNIDFVFLFWNKIFDYKIKNSMIIITEGSFRKNTYQYIITEDYWKMQLNQRKLIVCYDKEDRSKVYLFDENEIFISEVLRTMPKPAVYRKSNKENKENSILITDNYDKKINTKQIFKTNGTLKVIIKKDSNE